MPQYISCMAKSLRKDIVAFLRENGADEGTIKKVGKLPVCEGDETIGFGRGKGSGKKRAPSQYNIFLGKCVKAGKDFKQCAMDWRKQKE